MAESFWSKLRNLFGEVTPDSPVRTREAAATSNNSKTASSNPKSSSDGSRKPTQAPQLPEELEALEVSWLAALQREERPPPVLLLGSLELRRAGLVQVTAAGFGLSVRSVIANDIVDLQHFGGMVANLETSDLLYVQGLSALRSPMVSVFRQFLSSGVIEIPTGEGVYASSIQIPTSNFFLIGSVDGRGDISRELLDEFDVLVQLPSRSLDELSAIILEEAIRLEIPLESEGAREIATSSRGSAELAIQLLVRVRDFAKPGVPLGGRVVRQACRQLEPFCRDFFELRKASRKSRRRSG